MLTSLGKDAQRKGPTPVAGRYPRYGRFLLARDVRTIRAAIDRLQAAIESGVRSVSTDGVTTTFDSADAMRKTLGELRNELTAAEGGTNSPKPRIRSINLENCV